MIVLLGLSLVGCSKNQNGTDEPSAPAAIDETQVAAETSGFELALGTIKLENSGLSVNSSQAQELIPLWQAYASLSQSDITAQAELDAVMRQIQDKMTAEQLTLIESWELSAQDMQSIMDEFGIELGRGIGDGAGTGSNQGERPEGVMPGQGMGGGQGLGGGMGSGIPGSGAQPPADLLPGSEIGSLDADSLATLEAQRSERRAEMNFLPINLINALVEILQGKIE